LSRKECSKIQDFPLIILRGESLANRLLGRKKKDISIPNYMTLLRFFMVPFYKTAIKFQSALMFLYKYIPIYDAHFFYNML